MTLRSNLGVVHMYRRRSSTVGNHSVLEANTRKEYNLIHTGAAYRLVGANAREQWLLAKRLDVHAREFNRERKATERLARSLLISARRVEKVGNSHYQPVAISDRGAKPRAHSSLERRVVSREGQRDLIRASSRAAFATTTTTKRGKSRTRPTRVGGSASGSSSCTTASYEMPAISGAVQKPVIPEIYVECVDPDPHVALLAEDKDIPYGGSRLVENEHFLTVGTRISANEGRMSSPVNEIYSASQQLCSRQQQRGFTPIAVSDNHENKVDTVDAKGRCSSAGHIQKQKTNLVKSGDGKSCSSLATVKRPSSPRMAREHSDLIGQMKGLLSSLPVREDSPTYRKRSGNRWYKLRDSNSIEQLREVKYNKQLQ